MISHAQKQKLQPPIPLFSLHEQINMCVVRRDDTHISELFTDVKKCGSTFPVALRF